MSHNDTTSLYQSSQSDIVEIENMINNDGSVLPARPSIPVTSSPFVQSNLPTLPQDTFWYNSILETLRVHLYTGASCGVALFIAFSSLLILSLSSFQSEVFAVAFALLAAGAVILTLNVLLLLSTHLIRRTYNLLPKPKSKCNGSPTLILSVPPYAELNRFIL
uniref:Uncharacterized protein n=1 Tax=Brassica oleracea var. oleracea TaxID=109376 RepID=A0A0D3DGY9_BRAOL